VAKGTSGNVQRIKLSTTTGFYDSSIPVVSGAIVTMKIVLLILLSMK
jgi:hypothetical protein